MYNLGYYHKIYTKLIQNDFVRDFDELIIGGHEFFNQTEEIMVGKSILKYLNVLY